ncbi:MAG: AraC family transcriptional regulator [Bacteroidales bacterium]|jgi:AraC-like DNA-binding protein|nr:helix-turn-helix domain-containing protein [Bacteroidales bacterium]MCK9498676.1 helix-turn-helix domain-containing protein [Bacteroidales bacterium]MDY0313549.1 helix-turn-helix domain-containing protein [Bacteroidales bacterium]NLB87273.1 AraC family transcriptional regulator [Bacteroidales bacterium]
MNKETKINITRTILEIKNENLKPYIYDYWVYITTGETHLFSAITTPPLGYPTIQFVLGNYKGFYQLKNKNIKSLITGQYARHVTLSPSSKMGLIIVNFKPYGFYNFFGKTPPSGKQDTIEGAVFFGEESINNIVEKMSNSKNRNDLIDYLEGFLLENQKKNIKKHDFFDSLVDDIYDKNGLINLDLLINGKFSIRTLQRYFSKVIGISPKTFSRILRHKYIIQLMYTNPEITWNDLSFQGYYFDQSHFIKDFNDFTKFKPTDYNCLKTSVISELFK